LPPNSIQLNPEQQSQPGSKTIDRQIKDAGMIILVDTSGSMQPDQMASACAMDAYFQAAAGAEYSIGIATMDVTKQYNRDTGVMTTTPAHLVGLEGGSCDSYLQCDCSGEHSGSVCAMAPNGQMISSNDPNAEELLRELIVQGDNEESDGDEAGMEKAFLLVFDNIKQGRPDEISQVVAISDESANDDDRICDVQDHRYDPTNLAALKAVLGQDFNPPANVGDCDSDLTSFYIYFFTRYGIQVNALSALSGCGERCHIYPQVAAATGGISGDICSCESFVDFFRQVGVSTNTISTQLCLDEAIDPNTLIVTYTEGGVSQNVPQSDQDGWSYNASLNCILLNGSWASKFGTFEVSYQGLQQQVSSVVCFPPGIDPLPDTIVVSYQGQVIPKDATNGWTFDPQTDCLTFHGSYGGLPGPFDITYL
jgi:hypothetical protein